MLLDKDKYNPKQIAISIKAVIALNTYGNFEMGIVVGDVYCFSMESAVTYFRSILYQLKEDFLKEEDKDLD